MGIASRLLAPAALASLAGTSAALAADYLPPLYEEPVYVETAEEYVPVEVGSGWYLRGDVGYLLSSTPSGPFPYRTYDPASGNYGQSAFATGVLDGDLAFGVGIGYRFTDWIRADLTAERFDMRFNGTTTMATPCPGQPTGTCRTQDSSSLGATGLMANVYVDLGTIAGFTPYVGAGAGFTIADWRTLGTTFHCVSGAGACAALPAITTERNGISTWRFTYAAMAGIAYDISDNLKVDLGYKYRHVSGGDMFHFTQAQQALGASGAQGRDSGFGQHEIRIGLRYALW